jgi:hypothetical protein
MSAATPNSVVGDPATVPKGCLPIGDDPPRFDTLRPYFAIYRKLWCYGSNETVSKTRPGLDEVGVRGRIRERIPKFVNRPIEPVFVVDKHVIRPQLAADLIAGNKFARARQKQPKYSCWLVL